MIFPELISIRGQEDITKTESLLEQMQREIQGQKAFRPWTNGSHGSFGWCCWMLLKLGNNDVMIEEPFSIMFYLLNLLQFDISLEALWSPKCCRSQRFDTVQFKTCFLRRPHKRVMLAQSLAQVSYQSYPGVQRHGGGCQSRGEG